MQSDILLRLSRRGAEMWRRDEIGTPEQRVVAGGLTCRILAAVAPVSMLAVSKRILDGVQARFTGHPLPPEFWYLVAAEFALAALAGIISRAIGYFDALLADGFTRHVSVLVMEHASQLDLAA